MFKRVLILCLLLLSFPGMFAQADTYIQADTPIPERFRSIFEVCGVENEEELFEKAIDYMIIAWNTDPANDGNGKEYAERYINTCRNNPLKIRYGATTKGLIANRNWDIAVASSKDVDLQALADEILIYYVEFGHMEPGYRQCLLPEELVTALPNRTEPYAYRVYHFDYDAQTNDATLLIAKANKDYTTNVHSGMMEAIMDARPADMVRELEGICRAKYWTVDQLIEKPEEWDTAVLDVRMPNGQLPEEIQRLDEAGLLYDLSQNSYFASRPDLEFTRHYRTMARGIFSEDGRMVAVPCKPYYTHEAQDAEQLFIVNKGSKYMEKALEYGELILKMNDAFWGEGKLLTLDEVMKW